MKKFISAILSIAMALSCVTISVHAEVTSTAGYTINADTKIISGVKPLTKVSAFESTFSGATVNVVNVDGSAMDDNAYATENVFVNIDGELYSINMKYGYAPIQNTGAALQDGTSLYNIVANQINNNSIATSGLTRLESHPTFDYGTGTNDTKAPANTADQTVKATKETRIGEPVYVIENDSNNYAYLRSHFYDSSNYSTTLNSMRDTWGSQTSPIVTSFEFEADKLGNISFFHNTPIRDGSGTMKKGDIDITSMIYGAEAPYAPLSISFLEDGSVKLGGIYGNTYKSQRTPGQSVDFEWEAGKKYNVSFVMRLERKKREGYVYGVYINGTKVFPYTGAPGHSDGRVAMQADGSYLIKTKDSSTTHGGDISSMLVGTAPATPGENLKVYLSDFKAYPLAALADFNAAITNADISLTNATDVTVIENDTVKMPSIEALTTDTVATFKAKYTDKAYAIGVYNADGTLAAETANLATGMTVKIASQDGLQGKTYNMTATTPLNTTAPESTVYTVDTAAKTISNVPLFTTVGTFLGNFVNGSIMQVVNIDGSAMANDAYATEHVSLKAPNGDLYKINVKYVYSPIQTDGASLSDNASLYNFAANTINGSDTTAGGFAKVHSYAKIGYGSGNAGPANTADQTVKGTKKTENGETVYVMENDSNNYAYLKSHFAPSGSTQPTALTNAFAAQATGGNIWNVNTPIVTTVEFEADKYGNISLFNNSGVRDKTQSGTPITKPDSSMESLFGSAELPYVANSVHFLEDGSVQLGGIYTNWSVSNRTPKYTTSYKWEPGKKYTVSVVQTLPAGTRYGTLQGVYVNGTKIFPYDGAEKHAENRVGYVDGVFKLTTKGDTTVYGGGLSSIMIGTAPKTAGENLTVSVSDVKVYTTSAYKPAKDAEITIASNDGAILVDNGKAVINAMKAVDVSDFTSDAKLKLENGYLKAVSADGLVMKTYKIVQEDIRTQFLNGENGPAITDLAVAGNSVCFMADVQDASLLNGVTPMVILAAYDKDTFKLLNTVIATGTAFTDEITRYKGVLDISEYNKSNIVLRGFVWDGFTNMNPLTSVSELK